MLDDFLAYLKSNSNKKVLKSLAPMKKTNTLAEPSFF